MTLYEAAGEEIRVTFKDNSVLEGRGHYYTSALDNPEEKASLAIGNIMFFEDEVKKIELLTK